MRTSRRTGWWGATAIAALTLGCGLEASGLGPWDGSSAGDGDVRIEADAVDVADDGLGETVRPEAESGTEATDVVPPDDGEPPMYCGDGIRQPGEECEPGEREDCLSDCGSGLRVCSAVCTWDICRSTVDESCNGVDDDCSGRADDGVGMECVWGMEEPCGPCGLGVRTCNRSTCTWDPCVTATPDVCERGTTEACTAPICGPGHRTCLDACVWSDCVADVNECVPGTTQLCDGGDWCGEGVQTCGEDCRWGPCDGSPPWECTDWTQTRRCEKYPYCWGLNTCERGCHWSTVCHTIGC